MTIILPQKSRNTIAIRFLVLELRAIRSIFRLIAVGVVELTRMAQDLDTSLYKPLQLYAAAGLLYFVINRVIAAAGKYAERRMAWGRA